MGASVQPITPDEHEFQAWKASQHDIPDANEFEAWKAAQGKATENYDHSQAKAGVVPSLLRGATFGLSDKAIAGGGAVLDAAGAKLHGGDFTGTLSKAYHQNYDARQAAAEQYHQAHPVLDTSSDLAGGILPIVASGGTSAAGEAAASIPRLARFGKTILSGAKYGAANAAGRSDALEHGRGVTGLVEDTGKGAGFGAAAGALSIPAAGVIKGVASKVGLPGAISSVAGKVGKILPPGRAQNMANEMSGALGPGGVAAQQIARKAAQDAEGGYKPPAPLHPSVPPLALDAAGPNVENMADRIANQDGPGNANIRTTLLKRQEQMRPAITTELENGTGVKSTDRLGPLQEAHDARTAEAKTNYDQARAETKDGVSPSPAWDYVVSTKAGAQALKAAEQELKGKNMFHAAPSAPQAPAMPEGFSPEQWQQVLKKTGYADITPEGPSKLVDPETVHIVKRRLSKMAKLGNETDPMTAEAHSLLPLIDQAKNELPDAWRKADAAYAQRSRLISMMDRGRKVFNTPINPNAEGQKALNTSLGGLDKKLASSSPDEQQATQVGAATAAHAKLLSAPSKMASPGTVFNQSPQQVEQLSHAFPTPEKAGDFQHAVGSWDRTQAQAQRITGGSQTAKRSATAGEQAIVQPGDMLASRPRMVGRRILNSLDREYQAGQNAKTDAEIAKVLMNPKAKALQDAVAVGNRRGKLLHGGNLLAGALAGQEAGTLTDKKR